MGFRGHHVPPLHYNTFYVRRPMGAAALATLVQRRGGGVPLSSKPLIHGVSDYDDTVSTKICAGQTASLPRPNYADNYASLSWTTWHSEEFRGHSIFNQSRQSRR